MIFATALSLRGSTYGLGQEQLASAASMNYTGNKTGSSGNASTTSSGKISSSDGFWTATPLERTGF
jgi:hypothetical protein